jgi:hypothetical protein
VLLLEGDLASLKSASDLEYTGVVYDGGEKLRGRLEWEGTRGTLIAPKTQSLPHFWEWEAIFKGLGHRRWSDCNVQS